MKTALLSATSSTLPAPVKAMDRVCVYTLEVLTLVKTANLSLGIGILKQIDVLMWSVSTSPVRSYTQLLCICASVKCTQKAVHGYALSLWATEQKVWS